MDRKTFIKTIPIAALGSLLFSSCSKSLKGKEITLPAFPALPTTSDSRLLSRREIESFIFSKANELQLVRYPSIEMFDNEYIIMDHDWMKSMMDWWESFKFAYNIRYEAETFDCDDFARTLVTFCNLAMIAHNKPKAQPVIGTISVRSEQPFAGVKARGNHQLNFFVSNKGIFVLEPQNSKIVELDKYPNITSIYKITI